MIASLPAFLGPAALAQTGSTAGWTQFQGDSAHTGSSTHAPAPPYAPTWTARPEAKADQRLSPPVVGGGAVVVTSPDAIFAFDAADGTQLWRVERDGPPITPAIAEVGKRTAVVYTDGRDADTSRVLAVDLQDGRSVWGTSPALKDESRSGVTVDGDRAFVADQSGFVYSVALADGTVAWTGTTVGSAMGPLAVADGAVIVVVGGSEANRTASVVALDESTGEQRWSVEPDALASFGSLASVAGGTAVIAFPDGSVVGLSTADGSEVWRQRIPALVSPLISPAAADGAVLLADSTGGLHRLSPATGSDWLFEFNQPVLRASPVVAGGDVIVGFEDGSIGAVSLDTGHMVFRSAAASAPVSGIALAGDGLFVSRSGGGRPEVVGLATDPSAALVDVRSPTVPVPADLAVGLALALALGAFLFVPGRLLARRHAIEDPSASEPRPVAEPDRLDEDPA